MTKKEIFILLIAYLILASITLYIGFQIDNHAEKVQIIKIPAQHLKEIIIN